MSWVMKYHNYYQPTPPLHIILGTRSITDHPSPTQSDNGLLLADISETRETKSICAKVYLYHNLVNGLVLHRFFAATNFSERITVRILHRVDVGQCRDPFITGIWSAWIVSESFSMERYFTHGWNMGNCVFDHLDQETFLNISSTFSRKYVTK